MPKTFTSYSDQELLALTQEKDEQAFAILYERYYLPLCKKAFQRIPARGRVEEIVQDVFVNLWVKAETLDTEGNVRAYLYATLRNKILHDLRTEANRSFYMEQLKKLKHGETEAKCLQNMYAGETEKAINRIIKSLSPQCRKAFELSRFEQLSYKEISDRMQISVRTVEKHISKALHIIRANLEPYNGNVLILIIIFLFYF